MKKNWLKGLAVILGAGMILSGMPVNSFAADAAAGTETVANESEYQANPVPGEGFEIKNDAVPAGTQPGADHAAGVFAAGAYNPAAGSAGGNDAAAGQDQIDSTGTQTGSEKTSGQTTGENTGSQAGGENAGSQSADGNAGSQAGGENAGSQSTDGNTGSQAGGENAGGQSADGNAGSQAGGENAGGQNADGNTGSQQTGGEGGQNSGQDIPGSQNDGNQTDANQNETTQDPSGNADGQNGNDQIGGDNAGGQNEDGQTSGDNSEGTPENGQTGSYDAGTPENGGAGTNDDANENDSQNDNGSVNENDDQDGSGQNSGEARNESDDGSEEGDGTQDNNTDEAGQNDADVNNNNGDGTPAEGDGSANTFETGDNEDNDNDPDAETGNEEEGNKKETDDADPVNSGKDEDNPANGSSEEDPANKDKENEQKDEKQDLTKDDKKQDSESSDKDAEGSDKKKDSSKDDKDDKEEKSDEEDKFDKEDKDGKDENDVKEITQTAICGDAVITAVYSSDVFDADVVLTVTEISGRDAAYAAVTDSLGRRASADKAFSYDRFRAFDIRFTDENGSAINPSGSVAITIETAGTGSNETPASAQLLLCRAGNAAETVPGASVSAEAKYTSFIAQVPGIYAIAIKDRAKAPVIISKEVTLGSAVITVSYESDAFEEEVTFTATEITVGSADYNAVENQLDGLADASEEFDYSEFKAYDISFYKADGSKAEPSKPVSVNIVIVENWENKEVESSSLVHIPDEGSAEVIADAQITTDAKVVNFENDEFSIYVVTAKNADGAYEVGGKEFDDLAKAINAVSEENPVILVKESKTEKDAVIIPEDKNVILAADGDAVLTINNKVTVYGSLEINDGIIIQTASKEAIVNNGTLSILGGEISRKDSDSGEKDTVINNGNFSMSGGSIQYKNSQTGQAYRSHAFTNNSNASISGGSIICDVGPAIYNSGTISEITGGTFTGGNTGGGTSSYATAFYNSYSGTIGTISGGVFRVNAGTQILLYNYGIIESIAGNADFSGQMKNSSGAVIYNQKTIGTISGNAVIASLGGGSAISLVSGAINSISGGTITSEGTPAIYFYSGNSSIETITGNALIKGGTYGISITNGTRSHITAISGGTIQGTSNYGINLARGYIGTISGGEISGKTIGLYVNSTYTDGYAVNSITGSASISGSSYGLFVKNGTVGSITEGRFSCGSSGATVAVAGSGAGIDEIAGGEMIGRYAVYMNLGTINNISGGVMISEGSGNRYAVYVYAGTINSISGGLIKAVSTDGSYAYGIYNIGTIGTISGGTMIGYSQSASKEYAVRSNSQISLEPGLTGQTGNTRFQTNSNTVKTQVNSNVLIPTGYHMSTTTVAVPGQEGQFHYLVKDSVVIYDGNGGKTAGGDLQVSSQSTTVADNEDIGFEPPAGLGEFLGWSTSADGEVAYTGGETLTIPETGELVLYAVWDKPVPFTVTVVHSFDYLVDSGSVSSFQWSSQPFVSESFDYAGLQKLSPQILWERSTDLIEYILGTALHPAAGVALANGQSFGIGALFDVDLAHPAAPYPFTYTLTGVNVNGAAVTDLSQEMEMSEDTEIVFSYSLVPIEILISFNDLKGVYKGSEYSYLRDDDYYIIEGSDGLEYWVYPSWTISGGQTSVGSKTLMPVGVDSSGWSSDADGNYYVPDNTVRVESDSDTYHSINVSGDDYKLPIELFDIKYKPVTITVSKRPVTITVEPQTYVANGTPQGENNGTYTYSGNAQGNKVTINEGKNQGLAAGETLTVTLNGMQTKVGEYNDAISVADYVIKKGDTVTTDNYEVTTVPGKLTIESNETIYTVKHLQQNAENENYTEVVDDRQVVDSEIGIMVTPDVNEYEGFVSPAPQTVNSVEAEGKTVVEYKYDRKIINAKFDKNDGGQEQPQEKSGKFGSKLGTLPEVSRSDAVFLGWFTLPEGGRQITADTTFPAEDVTYYAQWKEYYYEVTAESQTSEGDGQHFTVLQDAVDAVTADNPQILALKDNTENANITIPAGKNIILNVVDGVRLTINGYISVSGSLDFNEGIYVNSNSADAVTVNSGGSFTMHGGELLSKYGTGLQVNSGGTVALIEAGTIQGGYEDWTSAVKNSGRIEKISGGQFICNGSAEHSAALYNSSYVDSITGGTFTAAQGDASAIYMFSNGAVIGIGSIEGGTFTGGTGADGTGLYFFGRCLVGEIKGGTFSGQCGLRFMATTDNADDTINISGGEFIGVDSGAFFMNGGKINITGGTFEGAYGLRNGTLISNLQNAVITGKSAYAIENSHIIEFIDNITATSSSSAALYTYGTINTIAGGTFTGGTDGIFNSYKIEKITGGTVSGGENGLHNKQLVGAVSGGSFTGTSGYGLYNEYDYRENTISSITGGRFKGREGIRNEKKCTIGFITAENLGDVIVTGTGGSAVYNAGVINTISGGGIYTGTDHAIETVNDETPISLEPGITALIGNGRYKTDGNTSASQLSGAFDTPFGYHMSETTLPVSGFGTIDIRDSARIRSLMNGVPGAIGRLMDAGRSNESAEYHYLMYDFMIIYDGNGHEFEEGGSPDDKYRTKVIYEDADAEVPDNDAGTQPGTFQYGEGSSLFLGWNTEKDGTGDFYQPGDLYTIVSGEEPVLYAQWLDVQYSGPADEDVVYDGQKHEVDDLEESDPRLVFTVNASPALLSGVDAKTEGTNVGTYQIELSGSPSFATPDGKPINIGNLTVEDLNRLLEKNNIILSKVTIEPRPVKVKAEDITKEYGQKVEDQDFNAEIEGLVEGDTLKYLFSCEQEGKPGTYDIIIRPDGDYEELQDGTILQGNYLVTYEGGTLTIGQPESETEEPPKPQPENPSEPESATEEPSEPQPENPSEPEPKTEEPSEPQPENPSEPEPETEEPSEPQPADQIRIASTATATPEEEDDDEEDDVVIPSEPETPESTRPQAEDAELTPYILTVNYLYLDGTTAAATVQATLTEGEAYNIASPLIAGFNATIATVTGIMPAYNEQITVFYLPVIPADNVNVVNIEDLNTPLGIGQVYNTLGICFE